MNEKFLACVAKTLSVAPEQLNLDMKPGDLPKWDSLGHLKILMNLEKEFGIRFATREMQGLTDLRSIQEAVVAKTSGA
jgi:acyl carrier protein